MNTWDKKRLQLEEEETRSKRQLDQILEHEQQLIFDMGQKFGDLMNVFYHFDREITSEGSREFNHITEVVSQEFQQSRQKMQRTVDETAESRRDLTRYYNNQIDEVLYQKKLSEKVGNRA
ncbi:MAG TPA: hypothetical protein H9869_05985 [Candidatus Ligilactobacillus excrementipullorum]|nr:hypothetical protein [Candidatus Ligilactobacillus excrementipullorum]